MQKQKQKQKSLQKAQKKKIGGGALNPFYVKVGEIWLSCDRREKGRQIRIQEVKGDKARVTRLDALGIPGPSTWIKLSSFYPNSRGYERAAKTVKENKAPTKTEVADTSAKCETATGCEVVERADVPGEDPDPDDGEAETGEEPRQVEG